VIDVDQAEYTEVYGTLLSEIEAQINALIETVGGDAQ
jgi:hypothetical protein